MRTTQFNHGLVEVHVTTEIETDSLYLEVESRVNFYVEPADPAVGFFAPSFSVDGFEIVNVDHDSTSLAGLKEALNDVEGREKTPIEQYVLDCLYKSYDAMAEVCLPKYTVSGDDFRVWLTP